jgi:D-alanyl-D-alanine carboxypeptidase/D-alanyl-D-alanine-endopeptidase (penicillin-binding protein 4)
MTNRWQAPSRWNPSHRRARCSQRSPVSPRRRGRTVALITVAALIVVAGAGAVAVFTVPGLKAKLGLGGAEPTVVLEPPPPPIQFAPALRPPGTEAAAPSAAGLSAALAGPLSAPGLGTLTGTVLDPATGTALWDQGAGTPLVPASTGKLLTAAAALLSVSHTAQFSTKVVAGKDPGSVVIVGGGDPTLSSLKVGADSVYPGAAHLSELVDQVTAHGTAQTVYVDVSRYAGNAMEASWIPGDVPGGYIAPIMSVMLDGGRVDATKETSPRSPTPAKAVAEAFANRIGAKVAPEVTTTAPQGAAVLGEVRSAPMVELVDTLLQRSDNVLAEAVGHEVARAAGEEPSFAGASRATAKVLRDNGFDVTGLSMADASGLSGQDKVPARLLASILAVAAGPDGKDPRTAKLRPLLGGLPVAGGSGTLAERYNTGGAAVGRGWVRAKTGTLSVPQVNSRAGIVLDNDGRLLVFALMTNGSAAGTARPALDTIAATLRKCGCK